MATPNFFVTEGKRKWLKNKTKKTKFSSRNDDIKQTQRKAARINAATQATKDKKNLPYYKHFKGLHSQMTTHCIPETMDHNKSRHEDNA